MRRLAVYRPIWGALFALAACATTTAKEDCAQIADPNRQIGGCTRAIQSGEYAGSGLALIYVGRGLAYERIGDLPRAVLDYDQAIVNDPSFGPAYLHRAVARCALGRPAESVEDRMEAMRLGALKAEDLQAEMGRAGFYKGRADGIFGPASRRALARWTEAGCPAR